MQSVKAVARWLPTPASQQHAAALQEEAARLAKDLAGLGAELVLRSERRATSICSWYWLHGVAL